MLALFDNTALARSRPAAALKILHAAVRRARAIGSPRAEADAVVATLLAES